VPGFDMLSAVLLMPMAAYHQPFPYTTLFRSLPAEECPAGCRAAAALPVAACPEGCPAVAAAAVALPVAVCLVACPAVAEAEELPDRKSTRLNSSHVKSSYAVFCLKKKNIMAD